MYIQGSYYERYTIGILCLFVILVIIVVVISEVLPPYLFLQFLVLRGPPPRSRPVATTITTRLFFCSASKSALTHLAHQGDFVVGFAIGQPAPARRPALLLCSSHLRLSAQVSLLLGFAVLLLSATVCSSLASLLGIPAH